MTYAPDSGIVPPAPPVPPSNEISRDERDEREADEVSKKLHQAGIGFPSASKQRHLLVIRLNIAPPQVGSHDAIKAGLLQLCSLFKAIDDGTKKIDVLSESTGNPEPRPLRDFHFSATLGFGQGFFDVLKVADALRPSGIRPMPDHKGLGDVTPYSLGQTDLIIQIGSKDDFVNRWVLENAIEPEDDDPVPQDIVRAVEGWATICDVHSGFQRTDGRNLQGFNDGVSNPNRLSDLFTSIVWTTSATEPNASNRDGTYMVFQKIVHDLDQWRELDVDEQQEWVGRSKKTGLVLGTISADEDSKLANQMHSPNPGISEPALDRWHDLFDPQSDPTNPLFQGAAGDAKFVNVVDKCPAWAHVRKANPRTADGTPQKLIFRRGYPFMESGMDHKTKSGLLFISFRSELDTFEFIKSQWFGDKGFPTPKKRPDFTPAEIAKRHQGGRFTVAELNAIKQDLNARQLLGLAHDDDFAAKLSDAAKPDTQNTGREGLAGPSELGVTPTGEFLAIVPLGGGYYFVPPIPNKDISQIGQAYLA